MADRLKILLVDDEPDILSVLKLGLERLDFEVDTFNEPAKALSQFKANYYDAIILDIRMPGMSGFYLAREIWAKDEKARICFLTAFAIYEHEAKMIFTSFKQHCFIEKPIIPRDLAKHIQDHLITAK